VPNTPTSSEVPKNIVLKGDPIRKEGVAGGTIKPGQLITFNLNDGKLVVHGDVQSNAAAMFAVEQDFIGGGIDKEYAANDQVQYVICRPGDEVYGFLNANENVKRGDFLSSAGNGAMAKHDPLEAGDTEAGEIFVRAVVARANEDLDLSGDSTGRLKLEVV